MQKVQPDKFFYLGYGYHADSAIGMLGFVLGEIVVPLEKAFVVLYYIFSLIISGVKP